MAHQQEDTSEEIKNQAKTRIIQNSLAEDQQTIFTRWVNTFLFPTPESTIPSNGLAAAEDGAEAFEFVENSTQVNNELACNIIKLVFAAISQGNLEIKTQEDGECHKPGQFLKLADYLSHASRVILEFTELSGENKKKFREMFDQLTSQPLLYGRTSTHYIIKGTDGKYHEGKSKADGATKFVKLIANQATEVVFAHGFVKTTDYGVNVQMGGFGKVNLAGGKSKFGTDGHILLCIDDKKDAILFGLEQTAPEPLNAVFSSSHPDSDVDHGLSGTHSVAGAPDLYTAPGSLYFSNFIYKSKLYQSTKTLTPLKYNGMRVVINDDNFGDIMAFYQQFLKETDEDKLATLLTSTPQSSVEDTPVTIKAFFSTLENKDIEAAFSQLETLKKDYFQVPYREYPKQYLKHFEFIKAYYKNEEQLPVLTKLLSPSGDPIIEHFTQVMAKGLCEINAELKQSLPKDYEEKQEMAANIVNCLDDNIKDALLDATQHCSHRKTIAYGNHTNIEESINALLEYKKAFNALVMILEQPEYSRHIILKLTQKHQALTQKHQALIEKHQALIEKYQAALQSQNEANLVGPASSEVESPKISSANPNFLLDLCKSIFNLRNLGIFSAVVAVGLFASVFVPQVPLIIILGLAGATALVSLTCFMIEHTSILNSHINPNSADLNR